ncbi:MAG: condensation domain-containing protein, partial [Leptolyngbyaceae cyanobacterium]
MDKRKNIENIYPLSAMQQGILFHTLLAPESGVYVPQIVLTLTGELDAAALHRAWRQGVTHHDVLRTACYWEQRDDPFQVVYRQVELPWVNQDWRGQSPELQATRLQVFLECNQTQPFNLQTPPLVRLALMQVSDRTHHLIWAYHHLILDGWSAANLLKTVFSQYFAITRSSASAPSLSSSLPSPYLPISSPPPYAHYLTWLQAQDPAAAQTFWQSYLQGFSDPTPLPIGTPPASSHNIPAASTEQQHLLSPEQTAQLQTFAQTHQLTLNTLIQGALGLLLSRYCDRDDVVFGATGAGRPPAIPGAAAMVGLFINTLPVRVQVPAAAEVIPWLQQLQRDRASASTYEYSALMDVQAWSELPPGQAFFDCLLVMENYPVNAALLGGQSDLALEDVRFIEWTHFPLTLLVAPGEHLLLTAKYRRDRFPQDAIHRLLTHLEILLLGLTTHNWLRDVPLLTPAEQAQIHLWNQTATDYPRDRPLPALIEAQVDRTPEAIAVRFQAETLTYRDLNARANQLAHHLQSLGVGPEIPVAVCLDRSLDLVVALFGILKAGGAYLPLDPSYPRDRLTWMLQDAAPPVLITHSPTAGLLSDLPTDTTPINLTASPPHSPNPSLPYSPTPLLPHHPLSLLYTSGSTGRPKGVINTHRGLVNRLCWMQDAYPLPAAARVLQKTPLSFAVSAWAIFWPLMTGACLVL